MKRRLKILCLPLLAMSAGPVFAADSPPIELAPTGAWEMDYADNSCALRRTFGDPGKEVWLEFRQYSPDDYFELTVASKGIARKQVAPDIRYDPDDDAVQPSFSVFVDYGSGVQGVSFSDSLKPAADKRLLIEGKPVAWTEEQRLAREAAVTSIEIDKTFASNLRLKTNSLKSPMKALRDCTYDLLGHWGLDPEVQKTLSRRATVKDLDTLGTALHAAHLSNDQTRIRLMVDPTGMPTSCDVQTGVDDPAGQSAACKSLLKLVRFDPALDLKGNPVPSYYVTVVAMRTTTTLLSR